MTITFFRKCHISRCNVALKGATMSEIFVPILWSSFGGRWGARLLTSVQQFPRETCQIIVRFQEITSSFKDRLPPAMTNVPPTATTFHNCHLPYHLQDHQHKRYAVIMTTNLKHALMKRRIPQEEEWVVIESAMSTMWMDGSCAGILIALRGFYKALTTAGVITNKLGAFLYPCFLPCYLHDLIKNHSSKAIRWVTQGVQETSHWCQCRWEDEGKNQGSDGFHYG